MGAAGHLCALLAEALLSLAFDTDRSLPLKRSVKFAEFLVLCGYLKELRFFFLKLLQR